MGCLSTTTAQVHSSNTDSRVIPYSMSDTQPSAKKKPAVPRLPQYVACSSPASLRVGLTKAPPACPTKSDTTKLKALSCGSSELRLTPARISTRLTNSCEQHKCVSCQHVLCGPSVWGRRACGDHWSHRRNGRAEDIGIQCACMVCAVLCHVLVLCHPVGSAATHCQGQCRVPSAQHDFWMTLAELGQNKPLPAHLIMVDVGDAAFPQILCQAPTVLATHEHCTVAHHHECFVGQEVACRNSSSKGQACWHCWACGSSTGNGKTSREWCTGHDSMAQCWPHPHSSRPGISTKAVILSWRFMCGQIIRAVRAYRMETVLQACSCLWLLLPPSAGQGS